LNESLLRLTWSKEMLIKHRPGIDQLALREARLSKRSIFSGLSPLKLPGDPSPGRESQ
jgi:hypothetical protein